jgi:hypothetical protein
MMETQEENQIEEKKKAPPEMKDGLRKKHLERMKSEGLEGIERVEARIHTISLTGEANFKMLNDRIGSLEFDNNYLFSKRERLYKEKYNVSVEGFGIQIFRKPSRGGPPPIKIQFTPLGRVSPTEHKAFLSKLTSPFPGLGLSKVEYAIDIYCKDPIAVRGLFNVLARNVLVFRQGSKPKIYPKSFSVSEKRNQTIYFGTNYKSYERGDDENKSKRGWKGWNRKDLNRVRMERTVKLTHLRKKGVETVPRFLESAKFFDLNNEAWNFKKFKVKRSKKLPREIDDYRTDGSFQGEYKAAAKKVKRPKKYLKDVDELVDLREDILKAMKAFDSEWEGSE